MSKQGAIVGALHLFVDFATDSCWLVKKKPNKSSVHAQICELTYFQVVVLRLANKMNIKLECDGFLRIIYRRVDDVLTPPQDGKLADLAAPTKEEKRNCVVVDRLRYVRPKP